MASQSSSDEIRTRVLTENTAQSVLNVLKALESNRQRMRTRWIWELLQNARDTSPDTNDLAASVAYKPGELVFQHNGRRFDMNQIAHLIYHGSTKVEDPGTLGQYGSGFLTTHLLSPEIDVSGQLNDGKTFALRLKREVGSVKELSDSMEQAWNDFNNSLSDESTSGNFTTRFQYPIAAEAVGTVKKGLEALKQCAPLVMVFNQEFSSIHLKSVGEAIPYKVNEKSKLPQNGLREITVDENGNENHRVYVLTERAQTSIAVPLEATDDNRTCLPLNDTPGLFLGFPLVGTENFSFPAVINSLEFTPTEDRDGVYLGQSKDKANLDNQQVIEQACELLIDLIRFAASSGWRNIYALANIPPVREQKWLNPDWLRKNLKERLIKEIRQTPAVLNEADEARAPSEARLPLAETDTDVESLWDLLDGWKEVRDTLPRRNEAAGWSHAIKSWDEPSLFPEVFDGKKLALLVDAKTHKNDECGTVQDIQELLQEDISAIEWLDQLHDFLNKNSLRDAVRTYHIVLDQDDYLDKLSVLHRDGGISEDLKDIAELLDWRIRTKLRDRRLSSLAEETGAGDLDNTYVVDELVKKLQNRAAENPDDDFATASVRLFAWIVNQENPSLPRNFPVFAEETDADKRRVIKLEPIEEEKRPLAPVSSWSKDLRPYSELFPGRRVLANAFFEAVPDSNIWRMLGPVDI